MVERPSSRAHPLFNPSLVLFLHILFGSLVFSNALRGEFCSDDFKTIAVNTAVKSGDPAALWTSFNTRFLTGLSFAWNYSLHGLDVFGYHLVNILLHAAVAFLVYLFVRQVLSAPRMNNCLPPSRIPLAAFAASLFFLLHPLQVQAVAYLTQRAVPLASIFYLGAMICYLLARRRKKMLFYLGVWVLQVLGMFSKEMTVTIPLAIILIDLLCFPWSSREFRQRWKVWAVYGVTALILPAAMKLDGAGSLLGLSGQMTPQFSWDYFFTELNVLTTYLRMMVWPSGLSHLYDYPVAQGFWEPRVMISVAFLLALIVLAVRQVRRRPWVSFGVLWFFLATSVEALSVCFIHKGVIYDHWAYLSMAGTMMLVSMGMATVLRSDRTLRWAVTVLALVLAALTYQRNTVWQTCEAMWTDVAGKYPEDPLAYANLGVLASRQGDQARAIQYYEKVLRLHEKRPIDDPRLSQIYVNLAAAYGRDGHTRREIELCKKAARLNPYNAQAHANIGVALLAMGRPEEAHPYLVRALELDPNAAANQHGLGLLYEQQGLLEKAFLQYRKALILDPDFSPARENWERVQAKLLEAQP